MWRPDGWEKDKYSSDSEWVVMESTDAYEAGADAMLEALGGIGDAFRCPVENIGSRVIIPIMFNGKSGRLVFIPDDKDE